MTYVFQPLFPNSYLNPGAQRLNSLLLTTDLDILISAESLLLRPAYQYSAQPSVTQTLNISVPRLQTLVKRWPHIRESGLGLLDLVHPAHEAKLDSLPSTSREVDFQFYHAQTSPGEPSPSASDPSPASDALDQMAPVRIQLTEQTLRDKSDVEIISEAAETHSMSMDDKFELLSRLRVARALRPGALQARQQLLVARLLAISIFGHTQSESQANTSLFLYEPDLLLSVAELLQVDHGLAWDLQSAAISTLDGMARYRNKLHEVLTAVNAGVNHGILMSVLRKTITDITLLHSDVPQSFVETLLAFISYISSHASGGNLVVGAGLIPLLAQLIDNKEPSRVPIVTKALQLLDNVLYSFANAFQLFCNARGVDIIVDRIDVSAQTHEDSHLTVLPERDTSQYRVPGSPSARR